MLSQFDFDAACRNREPRYAAWKITDLIWDWETATLGASNQPGQLITRLDQHLATRLGKADTLRARMEAALDGRPAGDLES